VKVYGAYTNRVLRLNLTDKSYVIEELPEEWKTNYIGARGFNMIRLLEEVDPNCDPLGPENKLMLGVSPASGTNMPGQRFNASAKSPLTGILGDSNAGGHWGTELKYAGYDQVILEGASKTPVYIFINNNKIEFRDASHLWKKDPKTVHNAIRKELDDLFVQVLCTGIGADNGVRFAGLFSNIVRANGRTGMGTVMSSKNVKAVAVRGKSSVKPYDFERYDNLIKGLIQKVRTHDEFDMRTMLGTTHLVHSLNSTGQLNTKNNQTGYFEFAENVSGERLALEFNVKNKGCFGCVIPCNRYFVVRDGEYKGLNAEGPEFESLAGFTSRILNGNLEAALKCIDLCTEYGIDTISTSSAISFAMECYDRGLINNETTQGLDLAWGNMDAVVKLVHQIGRKEKFGAVLADGILESVKRLGKETEPYAMHGKGLDVFLGEPRGIKAYGLGNAVASRGADHVRADPFFETLGDPQRGIEKFGMAEAADRLSFKGKGKVVKHYEALCVMADSLNLCKNTMVSMETLDFDDIAEIYNALTGFDMTGETIMKVGERVTNVERIFNMLCGVRKEDDTLAKRFLEEPLPEECGPSAGSVLELEPMLDEYYKERGWDIETGAPTRDKLEELGLGKHMHRLEEVGLKFE
jgi:aldehyde:ferredoxin oxidoreductase